MKKGVALISQSGMLATSLTMNRRSVAFSHVVSIGNQAALGAEDFVEALAGEPAVTGFALYLEGIRDPSRFAEAVALAGDHNKKIVLLRAGSHPTAAAIAAHHTASDPARVDALLERLDRSTLIEAETPNQLLETLKSCTHDLLPRGLRMVAFTCSGGDAAILADCAEARGLSFPQPSPSTRRALQRIVPDLVTVFNPLDCTTLMWGKPGNRTGVRNHAGG